MNIAKPTRSKLANVRLVAVDFDGVLTDNSVYIDEDAKESVRVSRADGLAVGMLRAHGVRVAIVSSETNGVVAARAKKLGVDALSGVHDKGESLRAYCDSVGVALEHVLFVGNDINDVPALEVAGCSAAPADAHTSILATVELVTKAKGGKGVLREIADLVIEASSEVS